MKKTTTKINFEELSNDFNPYEVCHLVFNKCSDLIKTGSSLIQENESVKPKLVVYALNDLCSDVKKAKEYKNEICSNLFSSEDILEQEDDYYNADENLNDEKNTIVD